MSMVLNNVKGSNNNKGGFNMDILKRTEKNVETAVRGLYVEGVAVNKAAIEKNVESIDANKVSNIQRAFALVSYSYGNMVGITTVAINSVLTLANKPEQFFVNGKVDTAKVQKVLKGFAKKNKVVKGYRYESVFKDQINKEAVLSRLNRFHVILRVSRHEIIEFRRRIAMIDPSLVTKEDLALIAKDFDAIGRAMQELSIDSTKDKTKDIGLDVTDFVSIRTKAKSTLIKKKPLVTTLDDIIQEKTYKDDIKTKYTMSLAGQYKSLAEVSSDDKEALAHAYLEDLAGELKDSINEGCEEAFVDLIKYYNSTSNIYASEYETIIELAKNPKKDVDKRLSALVKIVIQAIAIINNLFAQKADKNNVSVSTQYVNETASKLRAAIYTQGKKFGFNPQTVVRIAIAASFCFVKDGKINAKKKPSFAALWAMFPKEFICEYACDDLEQNRNDAFSVMLDVKSCNYDLCLDDELEFVDGFAETEYGFVVIKQDYTGKAIVTEQGIKALVSFYSYEETDAMFFEEILSKNIQEFDPNAEMVIPDKMVITEENIYQIKADLNDISQFILEAGQAAINDKCQLVVKNGDKVSIISRPIIAYNVTSVTEGILTTSGGVVFF